ncbi:DUF4159 domain-containing protein [Bryobacter aggregatus]|uniref:DUF4159 domain-containing protein n=1 Tax=Bryobacter aggregatus TaxID=360054 RepID=UPI0004E219AD|nr:DUF4159 domain-containing protein [Bryobacter aggregatus]
MAKKKYLRALCIVIMLAGVALAFQRGRNRPSFLDGDDDPEPYPTDAAEKTEWTFARLRYNSYRQQAGYWGVRGSWSTDAPKAERHLAQGIRRLSRVHARSVEEVVDLDTDKIFDYPWLYAVEVGHWDLSDTQAAKLREYLNRGGFLMVDDFHGTIEWEIFMRSMSRVFPDRPVVDINNKDAIFHILFDLDDRIQIPGIVMFYTGQTYEQDGVKDKWGGIYDDKGRIVVAICHNMDLGDAWEHADMPQYPERYTSMAYRIGLNYIIYSMTH